MITNFVWKNPSECELDSIVRVVLEEEAKLNHFSTLNAFWRQTSICGENESSILNKTAQYKIKWGLVNELKRSLNLVSKETSEFRNVLHDKRFQRFVLADLEKIYKIGLRHKMHNFSGMLNASRIVAHIESGEYSKYSRNDIRRLVEFHVHRSNSSKTFEGNKWAHGAYGSEARIAPGVGVVTRVTWGLEGDPRYEPGHANEEVHMTAEAGFTTLGSDRFAAEILGVQMASNHGKPEQLLVLNLNWTPESHNDFELSLTAWYGFDAQHDDEGESLGNEIFVGVSGSYKFEKHPFEPVVRFFKSFKNRKNSRK